MGIKEFIQSLGNRNRERKELARDIEDQVRISQLIEAKQKSANERELEKFLHEEREEQIKEELVLHRKARDIDIKFNHNPLNTKNIMKSEWEVMKERNMFAGHQDNICNQPATVMRNNPNMFKNNRSLCR